MAKLCNRASAAYEGSVHPSGRGDQRPKAGRRMTDGAGETGHPSGSVGATGVALATMFDDMQALTKGSLSGPMTLWSGQQMRQTESIWGKRGSRPGVGGAQPLCLLHYALTMKA